MADVKKCVVDINRGALKLDCRAGMTLFAALRMNKIFLPTGCGARGLCGQCRVRLVEGEANPLTESEIKLLAEEDRAAGWRLGCQVRLSGDMAIEVSEFVPRAREYTVTVRSITHLTHDIRRFSFSLAPGERITHRAGQFLNLSVKLQGPDGRPQNVIRCFSFATPASVEDRVDIIARLNPHGLCTPHLFEKVKVGDQLQILGPFGEFHLHEGDAPCIWIAGGSGLSPFLGMLQDIAHEKQYNRSIHLFFGAVKPEDLYYTDLLRKATEDHPWFKFTPALSGDDTCPECGDYGLITDVVARRVPDASCCEGYLCGSPGMLAACIKVLTDKGMDRRNIYFDRF